MRAVIKRKDQLVCTDMTEPEPGDGQVLVGSLACGICGSDLHALSHGPELADVMHRCGVDPVFAPDADMVFGHEFCAEVLDYGPGTQRRLKTGSRVVSIPFALTSKGLELIGYSNTFPGGFAERFLLTEDMLLEVPGDLSSDDAALTEPLAVGLHAVNQASLEDAGAAVVIGCGPVGLAVIACLKLRGFGPVIAADFSPARRLAAEQLGADKVVDPAGESPYASWAEFGVPPTLKDLNLAQLAGDVPKRAVIFECVGVPGVLQQVIDGAAPCAQIIVVGVCMQHDRVEPAVAITKQLDLRFVFAYTPEEFAECLDVLARGKIATDKLVTGKVNFAETPDAFRALASPEEHIKILTRPG